MARKRRTFTVNDGTLVLTLEAADEGGYVVTSPMEPALQTEADTMEEAFEMAYDALKELRAVRASRDSGPSRRASA